MYMKWTQRRYFDNLNDDWCNECGHGHAMEQDVRFACKYESPVL